MKIPPNVHLMGPGDSAWKGYRSDGSVSFDYHVAVEHTRLKTTHSGSCQKTRDYFALKERKAFIAPLLYLRHDSQISDARLDRNVSYTYFSGNVRGGTTVGAVVGEDFPTSILERVLATCYQATETVDSDDLMNLATARLNKNVDVGPFLAELAQSRKLVLAALTGIFRFCKRVLVLMTRHGIMDTVKNVIDYAIRMAAQKNVKGLADIYLQVIYAWRPLVSDLMAIYKQLKRIADGKDLLPPVVRGQAEKTEAFSLTKTFEYPVTPTSRFSGQGVVYDVTVNATIGNNRRALAFGRPLLSASHFVLMPITTLWDIIPFSFIVDWFINLSTVFKAWEASMVVEPLAGCMGSFIAVDGQATLVARTTGSFNGNATGDRLNSYTANGSVKVKSETRARNPRAPGSRLPDYIQVSAFLSHLPEMIALILSSNPLRYHGS